MPTISEFYGLIIRMDWNDRAPPRRAHALVCGRGPLGVGLNLLHIDFLPGA